MDDQQKEQQQTKGIKKKMEQDQDTIPMKKLMVQTDTIFKNWVNEWRINSLKYTSVDLSMHCSAGNIPPNFLMLSQRAIKRRKRSKVMIHYQHIPKIIKDLQKFYEQFCVENQPLEKHELSSDPVNEEHEELYKNISPKSIIS